MSAALEAVDDPARKWSREAPADPADLEELRLAAPGPLPESYLELLSHADGGEGSLGAEPGWFQLWPASTVLALNESYEIDEYIPGYFGFGSSGGGKLLALHLGSPGDPVFMVPFIPMEASEAVMIAPSFDGFLALMGRAAPDGESTRLETSQG